MEATLNASRRESRGKNEARRLRVDGRIPAVLYGGGEPVPIAVDPKALSRILHSESGVNTLISLAVDGEGTAQVLVKEYQLQPVTHALLHADFYRVAMDKPIVVSVGLVVRGEPRAVKLQGGILDFVHREVQIECLPGDIPENIEVDVTELMIGESIRLRDLATNAKWKPVTDPDLMLLHVVPPKAAPAEEAAPEVTPSAQAEPEVIKKGKTEKDEE